MAISAKCRRRAHVANRLQISVVIIGIITHLFNAVSISKKAVMQWLCIRLINAMAAGDIIAENKYQIAASIQASRFASRPCSENNRYLGES